eukprot:XP_014772201.1 PREDICTED: IgGFc-binding protein-like [Octopus bimaculoides]
MSDKLFIVKASEAKTGRTDVDMQFRLNNEILHSNIKWRPDITDYLKNFLMINFQQSLAQTKMLTSQAEMMIKGELMQLVGASAAIAKPDINQIGSYLKGEMSKVMQDTHETNNELYEMYDRNYLNVKYAVTVALRSMASVAQRVNYYVSKASMWVRGELSQFEKDLGLWFNTAVHNVLNVYPTTVALFAGKVTKQAMMAMQQWYEEWSQWHFETFKKFDSLSVQGPVGVEILGIRPVGGYPQRQSEIIPDGSLGRTEEADLPHGPDERAHVGPAQGGEKHGEKKKKLNIYICVCDVHNIASILFFTATASLFNDQHYITFDGQYNKFKGECSYILTRDFVDNNFTVIVNYQSEDDWNSKIDSILFYNGDQKIEILNSYTVRYNSRPVNLPLKLSDATVLRLGPVIKVTSEKGIELEYNPLQGFLIVEISGWYFGKVAGLFGTYNNEHYDELTPSNTRPARVNSDGGDYLIAAPNEEDLAQLASLWATPGCRSTDNLAEPDVEDEPMSDCADLFKSTSSPFSNCFDWVAPQNYYQMCVTRQSTDGTICSSAQFYTRQCARQGVFLTIPDYCGEYLTPICTLKICVYMHIYIFGRKDNKRKKETSIE